MFRIAAVGLILFFSFHSSGQSCLQKLDSANHFKFDYPLKAKFYANSLLADLDSGNCVSE